MTLALGSCHFSWTPLALRAASFSRWTLRVSSSRVFIPNHWNGVNALGTNPPTLTVTDAPLVCWRPISAHRSASRTMPRVSSSVSDGRPVRK
jgi:hypothetical protein